MLLILGNEINESLNSNTVKLCKIIDEAHIPGVEELIPAYCSILINYAPEIVSPSSLKSKIITLSKKIDEKDKKSGRLLRIPCAYGGHFGPDLDFAARHTGLSKEELIGIHSSAYYRVYMLGFLPGFAYLGGMDKRLTLPRLESPRLKIPRGAVGIGGSQTGVYPMESPGGWRLLGATPVDFYDPDREDPILCRVGDTIKFEPISSCDYYDIRQELLRGGYRPQIEEDWQYEH